jgi:hypothetical protein
MMSANRSWSELAASWQQQHVAWHFSSSRTMKARNVGSPENVVPTSIGESSRGALSKWNSSNIRTKRPLLDEQPSNRLKPYGKSPVNENEGLKKYFLSHEA